MAKKDMKSSKAQPGEKLSSGIYKYSDPIDGGDQTGNGPQEARRIIKKRDSFYSNVF